tara:strand:- start:139 stop:357 length:219 start_codon:yes stop_codon:yes gene_type:complete
MFNCPSCGKRANPPRWSTQFVMRDSPMATAIRKDQIDFGSISMDKHIERTNKKNAKDRAKKMDQMIFGNDKK